MRLLNIHIAGEDRIRHLRIEEGRIVRLADDERELPLEAEECNLTFRNVIAFPGLVNSHDHLDFNLFPFLGNRIYADYREWGSDIHRSHREMIAAILRVPSALRARWGLYKNLLNGVTTVIHHGPELPVEDNIISTWQQGISLHSVSGEKGWHSRLIRPLDLRRPIVIHTGEGTSAVASREIGRLIRWNVFRKPLVAVHGIAMTERQAASFRALVWCPLSNENLYGATARVDRLRHHIPVVLGTDSTLSASWNIYEHLRMARRLRMTDDAGLWRMVTTTPAAIWGLDRLGSIAEGYRADLVIARRPEGSASWDALYALDPADLLLVLHKGEISLFDRSLYSQLESPGFGMAGFYPVRIGDEQKYVRGDLPGLIEEIRRYYPAASFPVS
jgi:cytosine/adenosine deaminase-related metal-dependent hydrolase